jgi:tetratricopeptide (TPR) repeat protein
MSVVPSPRVIRFILSIIFGLLVPVLHAGTPEQVAEWQKRYQQGVQLEKAGKREEALSVFTGILKEDPNAPGSLLMSGLIQTRRFDFASALPFLEKFHELQPDHEGGLIALIKVYQSLGHSDRVEFYRKKLLEDRQSGKNQKLRTLLSYEREVIPRKGLDGGYISVQENLEDGPNRFIWAYIMLDEKNRILRRLEWTMLTTPNGTQYVLGEPKVEQGLTQDYKIQRLLTTKPDYARARELALSVLITSP